MDDALGKNVRLAVATGASVTGVISVALATAQPKTVREAIELLTAREKELDDAIADGGHSAARQPAEIEPELRFEPELARVRRDLRDHEIRGKLLYRDLQSQRSFFQIAIWAIAGLELSRDDAEYVEQLGVTTQLLDAQIWPMNVIRRLSAAGVPFGDAMLGAMATLYTQRITAEPVGNFMRFLDRADRATKQGRPLEAFLDEVIASKEKIAGFGRPVLGRDERVPEKLKLAERFGHRDGATLDLALRIETYLADKRGLYLNAAGLQAALLRDLGFSPRAAVAICALYFFVPAIAQATFSAEMAEAKPR